jgi:K+-sensing histidine kinase KdpD
MQSRLKLALGYIGAAASVVVFGAIAGATSLLVPLPRVSVLFLCAVLASAILWGMGPALFAAALSVAAAAYYFYPPLYDFRVASSQDLLDVIVFAIVSVAVSAVLGEIRRQRSATEDARVTAKTEELREALLNSISHDLQTPLASIMGAASAMQSFDQLYDSRARADLVATIREEAERLNNFIGEILDLTRIRAGALNPRLEFVELADIMQVAPCDRGSRGEG